MTEVVLIQPTVPDSLQQTAIVTPLVRVPTTTAASTNKHQRGCL